VVVHPYVLLEVQVRASSAIKFWMRVTATASWSREFVVQWLLLFLKILSIELELRTSKEGERSKAMGGGLNILCKGTISSGSRVVVM
jgi:hypothetical protein